MNTPTRFSALLQRFYPQPMAGSIDEKIRACVGALCGILFTGLVAHEALGHDAFATVFLIAPMGASAVLLFALPSSPLAQPWSIIGGNGIAAIVGVTCASLFPQYPELAASLAIMFAIGLMFALRCLHPPSGAVALTAVLGGPAIHQMGYHFVLWPVEVNSVLIVTMALLYNNLTRRTYPPLLVQEKPTHPEHMHYQFGFREEDLTAALQQYDHVLDINRDDLRQLIERTEMHAYQRKMGEIRCADIMSPMPVALHFGDRLDEAWERLRQQPYPAIPVINRANRVIGILSHDDFMRHAKPERFAQVESQFQKLIRRSHRTHTEKPEVVGQIMTTPAVTIQHDAHIVHVIPLITTHHLHVIPVLDDDKRLVGILSQTDVIKALYQ